MSMKYAFGVFCRFIIILEIIFVPLFIGNIFMRVDAAKEISFGMAMLGWFIAWLLGFMISFLSFSAIVFIFEKDIEGVKK